MTQTHWKILGYLGITMAWLSIVFPILTMEKCAQMKQTESSSLDQLGVFQQIMDMQEEVQTGLQQDPALQDMMADLGYADTNIDVGGLLAQLEPLLTTTKPMENKIERRKIRGLDILSKDIHLEDMYNIDNMVENPILEVYFPSYKRDIHLLLDQVTTVLYRIYLWALLSIALFAVPIPKLLALFHNISPKNTNLSDRLQHSFAGLFATFGVLFFISLLVCVDVFWDIDGVFGGLYLFFIGGSLLVLATLQITLQQAKTPLLLEIDSTEPSPASAPQPTNYLVRIAKTLSWSAVVSQIIMYIGLIATLLFLDIPFHTQTIAIILLFFYGYATYIYNHAIQIDITHASRPTQHVIAVLWIVAYLVPNIILPTLLFI